MSFKKSDAKPNKPEKLSAIAEKLCADPAFQRWLTITCNPEVAIQNWKHATVKLYSLFQIHTLAALDHDDIKAGDFNRMVRMPFVKWERAEAYGPNSEGPLK